MPAISVRECKTSAEVFENYRGVKERREARERVCLMKAKDLDNTTLAARPNDSEAAKFQQPVVELPPVVADPEAIVEEQPTADQTSSESCAVEMMLVSDCNFDLIDPNWGQLRLPRSSLKTIVACVAAFYGIHIPELLSSRRYPALLWPRQAAAYLAKKLTIRSLSEIGRVLNRDHSTILHSVRKAEYWIAHDPERADEVEYLHGILAAASSSAP